MRTAFADGPLAVRGFRLLLAGQAASTFGDFCYAVALPWLILSGDGGTVLLGTVLACYGIPRVLTIPLGGMAADRFGGRRVMLVADAARAAAVGTLAVLAFAGTPTLAQLAPIAVVLGVGSGIFIPCSYTVLPSLLKKDDLARGNALSTMVNQCGGLIGPAAGGALVATFGAWPALAADATSFVVSAVVLFRMGSRTEPAEGTEPAASDAAPAVPSGPTFGELLRKGRLLHVVMVVALISNLAFYGTIEVALPDLAHDRMGAAGYGTLLTCLSLGGLGGSLLAARARTAQSPAYLFGTLALVMGAALAATPYAGGLVGAALCLCVYGAASGWQNIVAVTMLQVWAPSALIGRVMSLVMLAVMGTFPVSVAVAGLGVRHLGSSPFFPTAGAAIALAVLAALTQRAFREYRAGDEYAANGPAPTAVAPDRAPLRTAVASASLHPAGPAAPTPVSRAAPRLADSSGSRQPKAVTETARVRSGGPPGQHTAPDLPHTRSTNPWHDSSQESQG
ncbi:hypothetical protein N566_05500 [Streptomycetaceae bacterium MP113-05]|nr:hypothetical protein N566_05500 [Streptomycetaceae bacterium MP113-05]